jgi:CubicO group peptidase (beta-lactamase class C family)
MGPSRREMMLTAGAVAATPALPVAAAPRGAWSEAGLDIFKRRARELGVLGLVALAGGETIVSDGEVSRVERIASCRKSFLSALYGMTAEPIDLHQTLAQVGMDDYSPLTDVEKTATIRDLLMARSGVYIPSSAESPAMKAARPKRGSHAPGTFWYYNNWDFNALGEIYQRVTGHSVFTSLEHQLAIPLGWQDFDPMRHALFGYDPEAPRLGAYNMWMSARDMARFGQLFLQRGVWNGKRLIPESWIAESTRPYSRADRSGLESGYGYLWWGPTTIDAADPAGIPLGTYLAAGNGGRYIVVLPSVDAVVAIQPFEEEGRPQALLYTDPTALDRLIKIFLAAHKA